MTVHERILAIRLLEQQEKNPEYLKELGIRVNMNQADPADDERRKNFV